MYTYIDIHLYTYAHVRVSLSLYIYICIYQGPNLYMVDDRGDRFKGQKFSARGPGGMALRQVSEMTIWIV